MTFHTRSEKTKHTVLTMVGQKRSKQVANLTTQLAEANQIMDELQRDLNQSRNETSILTRERDSLQMDVQRLNSILQATSRQVSEAGSQSRGIQEQLQQLIDSMNQLQQKLQSDQSGQASAESDE